MNSSPGYRGKRQFDVVLSTALLIVTAPIQAAIALVILVSLGRPILFVQKRPGLGGQPFTIYKFRTMRTQYENIPPESDAARMTAVGRLLRSTSLDELPELWNVLKGDMSLVGPRPLLMQYLDRYSPEQARRHDVPPGLTGLAQVSGRNAISWDEKFSKDLEYVDNSSLVMDVKILLRTTMKVLRRSDISATGSATMPEFEGNTK